jgi:hypothetical protein
MVIEGFGFFYKEIKEISLAPKRFTLAANYFFYLSLLVFLLSQVVLRSLWQSRMKLGKALIGRSNIVSVTYA